MGSGFVSARAGGSPEQGGTEISSKMCSIRNQSRMGTEGTSWNLRSEGYEMGIAKGRAFSAKRSVGYFRVGRMPSAIPKKFEITMESMYKWCIKCSSHERHGIGIFYSKFLRAFTRLPS